MKKIYIIKNNQHYITFDNVYFTLDFNHIKNINRNIGRYRKAFSPIFPSSLHCINYEFMRINHIQFRYKRFKRYRCSILKFNSMPKSKKFYRLD